MTKMFRPENGIQFYKLIFILMAMLLSVTTWAATDELINRLRLDYEVLLAAEKDFQTQLETNGLGGDEAEDYAAYIASLRQRVSEDCQAMVRSGLNWPEDLPCPVIVPPLTQSADIYTQEEQTLEEQIATLDEKLNAGLGEYDEKLLQEQERIKAASPNNNGDRGDGAGSLGGAGLDVAGNTDTGAESDNEDAGEDANSNETGDTAGQSASGSRDNSSGTREAGNDSDQPVDIPDGGDDDIVARQLREAAERETDPELKAKLWEEYRRYKRGTN